MVPPLDRPKRTGIEKGTGCSGGWEASALRPDHHGERRFTGGNDCRGSGFVQGILCKRFN
jgi:hypothetical protein